MQIQSNESVQKQFKIKQIMNELNSPFLKDIPTLKSKSRTIRKKIYKFLQSHHHRKIQNETRTNLVRLLQGKILPQGILANLQEAEAKSISFLEKIIFQNGIDLQTMIVAVIQQQKDVAAISNQLSPVFYTAQKRKPLAEIHQCQTEDKKRLFLTKQNEESAGFSLEGDFCSEISIFNGMHDLAVKKSKDQFQSIRLKENHSFLQMENRCSNRSNSLFDEPAQVDPLDFI